MVANGTSGTTGVMELDILIAKFVGAYIAFEALKDAIVGFASWWNVTDGSQIPAPPGTVRAPGTTTTTTTTTVPSVSTVPPVPRASGE
jgi:hypothetical protein